MRRALLVLLPPLVCGCFALSLEDGQYACGPAGECPQGLRCAADGRCRSGGVPPADAGPPDADGAFPPDGPRPPDDRNTPVPDVVITDVRRDVADAVVPPDLPVPGDMTASVDVPPPLDGGRCTITWKGTETAFISRGDTTTLELARPEGVTAGDFLLATMHAGWDGSADTPGFDAPEGWTLLRRADRGVEGSLLVFWKRAGSAEPTSYRWTASSMVYAVGWLSAYSGVDAERPIDVDSPLLDEADGTTYATPSITTTGPGELVIATFTAYTFDYVEVFWSTPEGMVQRANLHNNAELRNGSSAEALQADPGPVGPIFATASSEQDYALTHILALRPCQ